MPDLFRTYPVPPSVRSRPSAASAVAFPLALAFDFDRGDVALGPDGRPLVLDGDAAYEQWATLALVTQRGACRLYSRGHGFSRVAVLRERTPADQRATFEREARAALRDPRTGSVAFAWAEPVGRSQSVTISVRSVRQVAFTIQQEVSGG